MRIAELSRRSHTPIPTIKYYIREGLLPPGERTARTQATYDDGHLARLELIRSLREAADLPIETIKQTLDAIDDLAARPGTPHLAIALRGLSPPLSTPSGAEAAYARARERSDALLAELGWRADAEAAGYADLVRALVAIDRYWPHDVSTEVLAGYGAIAAELARMEIPDDWDPRGASFEALRYAVLGTVLFEPVLLALRRLAHVDRTRRLTEDG